MAAEAAAMAATSLDNGARRELPKVRRRLLRDDEDDEDEDDDAEERRCGALLWSVLVWRRTAPAPRESLSQKGKGCALRTAARTVCCSAALRTVTGTTGAGGGGAAVEDDEEEEPRRRRRASSESAGGQGRMSGSSTQASMSAAILTETSNMRAGL